MMAVRGRNRVGYWGDWSRESSESGNEICVELPYLSTSSDETPIECVQPNENPRTESRV